MANGVRLPDYSLMEQVDFVEAEKRSLLIEFGKECVRILSSAKAREDPNRANALIEHLKEIYFIGYGDRKRRKIKDQASELIRLTQMTFHAVPTPDGGRLEMSGGSDG